jgi:MFS family permease
LTDAIVAGAFGPEGSAGAAVDLYRGKWSALCNTTLGMLMATIDASIVLIALPNIFRGIHLNPLAAGNTSYFLWMLMGYMLVTAVLVVSFGRLGDIFGRVRMYNLGFAIFTVFSILLSMTWMHGSDAALFMIIMRLFQGVGGAFIMANSTAILIDAFPPGQRGTAIGINLVAGTAGTFIGLVLGGLLGPINWRLVFLISVPVGIVGTLWGFTLKDKGVRTPARIDWLGNVLFAAGLVAVLVGIIYGIEPYDGHAMGWTNPLVLAALFGGVTLLGLFLWVETKVEAPMFRVQLLRIRTFAFGTVASLMSALGRGGIMFVLIIWLQGIWLPEHGYSFARTPIWAGIFVLPVSLGFLVVGPVSGHLSDRYGPRLFATGGMLIAAAAFAAMEQLPIDFSYVWFAPLLLVAGMGMGMFASPNRAAVMNSLPPDQRGVGSGMCATTMNVGMVLSIGIFFTLIIVGLSGVLPNALYQGLTTHGVPSAAAHKIAVLPPTASVFAAFLGYNPIENLLGPSGILAAMPHAQAAFLTGRSFFPSLIAAPFTQGLHAALDFAIAACLAAAGASALQGKTYFHEPAAVGIGGHSDLASPFGSMSPALEPATVPGVRAELALMTPGQPGPAVTIQEGLAPGGISTEPPPTP